MKKLIIGLCCLVLSGCATMGVEQDRILKLQEQVSELHRGYLDFMAYKERVRLPATTLAGSDARWRNGRTDEGTHNVDEITGMSDGDWVIVVEEDTGDSSKYLYIYDSSGVCSPAADGLQRISGNGGGCWYRANTHPFHQIVTVSYTHLRAHET